MSGSEGEGPAVAHPKLLLVAACGSVAMVIALALGTTAMLPEMGRDLEADQADLQWIVDVFPLVVAALLLPAGTLLDRYGRKLGMIVGLAILTVTLIWSGLADSSGMVIAARAFSGVGAALVFPGTLATISHAVPDDRKMYAVGLWAMSAILGGMAGVDICALLTEVDEWGSAFLFLAVVSAALLVLTLYAVPETHSPHEVHLDPVGALLSIAGVGLLVFAVTEGPVHGWDGPVTVFGAAGGVLALALFVLWELRHPLPLLDVRLFADARFGASSVALFAMFFADFAMLFLVFQYEVYVLDYGTLKAALGVVPPALGLMAAVPLTPMLVRRFGRRILIAFALLVCALGTELSSAIAGDTGSYLALLVGTTVLWTGLGLGMVAPTTAILEAVPKAKQGVASAVNDLTRELGAAFGIAITGSAFNAAYREDVKEALGDDPAGGLATTIVDSPAAGLAALEAREGDSSSLVQVIEQGVMQGWRTAFIITSAVLLVSALFVGWRYPAAEPGDAPVQAERDPVTGMEIAPAGAVP